MKQGNRHTNQGLEREKWRNLVFTARGALTTDNPTLEISEVKRDEGVPKARVMKSKDNKQAELFLD